MSSTDPIETFAPPLDEKKAARIAKLPQWAQEELAILRVRLEESRVRAASIRRAPAGDTDTDTLAEPWDEAPIHLPAGGRVRFVLGPERGSHIEVMTDTSDGRKMIRIYTAGGRLTIQPSGANSARAWIDPS